MQNTQVLSGNKRKNKDKKREERVIGTDTADAGKGILYKRNEKSSILREKMNLLRVHDRIILQKDSEECVYR